MRVLMEKEAVVKKVIMRFLKRKFSIRQKKLKCFYSNINIKKVIGMIFVASDGETTSAIEFVVFSKRQVIIDTKKECKIVIDIP